MALLKSKATGAGKTATASSWEGGVKPLVSDTAELQGTFAAEVGAAFKVQGFVCASGFTGNLTGASNLEIGEALAPEGNVAFKLVSGIVTYSWTGEVVLKSSFTTSALKLFSGGKTIAGLTISKSAKYVLEEALTLTGNISVSETAALDFNGQTVKALTFTSSGTSGSVITLGASKITLTRESGAAWSFETATLSAGTSEITLTGLAGNFKGGGKTYNVVVFAANAQTVEGANTFAELKINNKGDTEGLALQSGIVQTVTILTTNGTEANPARLIASTSGTKTKIKLTGTQTVSFLKCKDIKVETGSLTVKIPTGTKAEYDLGGNEGITFEEETTGLVNAQAMMV